MEKPEAIERKENHLPEFEVFRKMLKQLNALHAPDEELTQKKREQSARDILHGLVSGIELFDIVLPESIIIKLSRDTADKKRPFVIKYVPKTNLASWLNFRQREEAPTETPLTDKELLEHSVDILNKLNQIAQNSQGTKK